MRHRIPALPASLAAVVLLAGCKSSFDVDFVAGPVPENASVTVRVEGVDLRRIDGDIEKLRRNSTGEFTLQGRTRANAQELLSDADISNGEYAGVRLILADDAGTVRIQGDPEEPIEPSDEADARDTKVAFDFDDGDDDDVRIVVALDPVLSLSQDKDTGEFTLDPVIRAMETDDAATISGTIPATRLNSDAACTSGTARVYAFIGTGVEPDERDGNGAEPIAVADIIRSGPGSAGTYEFTFMPPDDYTLAFTCESEFENGLEPADDEDIDFSDGEDIRLDPGEDLRVDFDA